MKISYMKVISNLFFIFVIINFLLCLVEEKPLNEYVFLWIAVFNVILYFKKIINTPVKIIIEAAIMLPIIFIGDNTSKLAIIFICAMILYLYLKNKHKLSYAEALDEFKKSFLITLFIAAIAWIKFESSIASEFILPYIIMYVIFSIVILRYLRNYEYKAVDKKMKKFNIIYSICMLAAAFILALKSVRQSIIHIISYMYNVIINILLYILTFLFFCIDFIFSKIFKGVNFKLKKLPELNQSATGSPFSDIKTVNLSFAEAYPSLYKFITISFNIVIVIFVFYIIAKVLMKKSKMMSNNEEYIETKEFIVKEKPAARLQSKLAVLFHKKSYYEQIRAYYSKFIEDCISEGIEIKKSDTTLNIYSKSKYIFNKMSSAKMRSIYLGIRYGNKNCTKQDVKVFYELYKNKKA